MKQIPIVVLLSAVVAVFFVAVFFVACAPQASPSAGSGLTLDTTEVEANRDGVFTVRGGAREALPSPRQQFLAVGDGVDVDEAGRAIVRFSDLLAVEVLRRGGLVLQELPPDERSAVVTVLQSGGTLLSDFQPGAAIERRFTIRTQFAVITATGTRFLVSREADSPLEWVVALDAAADDLQVTAGGVTKPVPANVARWIAPLGEPSAGIEADMGRIQEWIARVREGQPRPEIGEVVWSAADILADTAPLDELPSVGEPFDLNGVRLTLDPQGLFGQPAYAREDCNGDGVADIAIQAGKLQMDFRVVLARVRALDVTILNRDRAGSGSLRALDPGRSELTVQPVSVDAGAIQVLSLRSDQPYHYAELALSDGCFLGFSLTPPTAQGDPGAPRSAVEETVRPTVAPTVAPTRQATVTPTVGPLCRVLAAAGRGLNLRAGPGLAYEPPLRVLPAQTLLLPLARSRDSGWIRVEASSLGARGWVSADSRFIECTVAIGQLPVEEGPPLPATPIPTTAPTATPAPSTVVARIVQPSGRSPFRAATELVFRVVAYDPSAGDNDGDGIDRVEMRVLDPDGRVVHERTERTAGYCLFGGGEPDCTVWQFARNNYRWPDGAPIASGLHTLQATAYARGGGAARVEAQISLELTQDRPPLVVRIVQPRAGASATTELVFRVAAYDPGVGDRDGDGIDRVEMSILDPYGQVVHQRTERTAGYCAFGGGEPECNVFDFAASGYSWPAGGELANGTYTLRAVVYARDGRTATVEGQVNISLHTID